MKLNRYLFIAAGLTASLTAQADFSWSYSGAHDSGSGTLVAAQTPETYSGAYGTYTGDQILSLTGTFDGHAITGLIAQNGYDSNDNLIISGVGSQIDYNGISFAADVIGDVNLYNITLAAGKDEALYNNNNYSQSGTFTTAYIPVAPAAAPEPAQVVSGLLVAGMGGASLLRRRLRSRK